MAIDIIGWIGSIMVVLAIPSAVVNIIWVGIAVVALCRKKPAAAAPSAKL
jgi:hypothetical protein